jgi:hypothetical protein
MPRLDTPQKRKDWEQDLRADAQQAAIDETEETIETWWWHFTNTVAPNNGDQYYLMGVRRATTIVAVYTVITFAVGFPPTMDFQLSHDPTFKAGGPANVFLAAQTSTTATMEQFIPDDDATIPAGSVLWATMSNKVQTPDDWGLTLQLQWT